MSDDFDKYLAIANHDIQMANDYGQLKSYVASILYDYDKKVELLQQKESIIKEVREYIENNTYKIEWGDLEQDNEDINISEDITDKEFIESLLGILDKKVN